MDRQQYETVNAEQGEDLSVEHWDEVIRALDSIDDSLASIDHRLGTVEGLLSRSA
jgi:hypothetical protein